MTETLECVVIGAGVIGLAVARALAGGGREVVVLEAENAIGVHSSSRNSEVIHAGIYYPEGSLKARLCVRGRQLLYDYCADKGIPHERIGKLIAATNKSQLAKLAALENLAARNGVNDLVRVDRKEIARLEPEVEAVAGLFSPSTGIIDSHAYMLALQGDVEAAGGRVVLGTRVSGLRVENGGFSFDAGGETFRSSVLINAAGLWADEVARDIKDRSRPWAAPTVRLAKGHYFTYAGKAPFRRLVYPLPSGGGLGIHATLDLAGAARFGPDVTWVDAIDYTFDETRQSVFVQAVRDYFPSLDESRLAPGYTGIRPKLHGPDELPADFVIATEREHGIEGLVHLCGIESPGLTASLAIAEYVSRVLDGHQTPGENPFTVSTIGTKGHRHG